MKFKVVHVRLVEEAIVLCLEPLDRKVLPPTISPVRPKGMAGDIQATIVSMLPIPKQREPTVQIAMTMQEYEKLEKPNVMDTITLTMEVEKDG